MKETIGQKVPSFWRYLNASCSHALVMTLRRRNAVLAAAVTLTPVLIPLALAFLSEAVYAEDGSRIFKQMVERLYLGVIAPMLGLFFASMLIGEDVESQTIPYVLTRPIPRSALVVGKYAAYMAISTTVMLPAIALTFAACTALGGISFSGSAISMLAHYCGVAIMSLLGYGAVCMMFGALFKRPIIVGVVAIFGWQRLALYVPGFIDFFTIEKYVKMLIGEGASLQTSAVMRPALMEFQKKVFLISASKAFVALLLISCILMCVTIFAVRRREYTTARAVGR